MVILLNFENLLIIIELIVKFLGIHFYRLANDMKTNYVHSNYIPYSASKYILKNILTFISHTISYFLLMINFKVFLFYAMSIPLVLMFSHVHFCFIFVRYYINICVSLMRCLNERIFPTMIKLVLDITTLA